MPTTYPDVDAGQLRAAGFSLAVYANQGLRASITAMRQSFAHISEHGSTRALEDGIAELREVFQLQG